MLRPCSCNNFSDGGRRPAQFWFKDTGEKLLAACFKYGSDKQLIIVKETDTSHVNGGEAVIVTECIGRSTLDVDYSECQWSSSGYNI